MKTILITGFDANYFNYGVDLIRSIRNFKELEAFDIGVLDLGVTPDQLAALETLAVKIQKAFWNIEFAAIPEYERTKPGFKAMVARPFLPDYFPGYDNLLWIDADIWLQSPQGVLDFVTRLQTDELCAVPELDTSYVKFSKRPKNWLLEKDCFKECFDEELSEFLFLRPQINTGFLALRASAPHWKYWQYYLSEGLKGSFNLIVEQLSLNLAVYKHDLAIARFPSIYNWICHLSGPSFCCVRNRFVTPDPPHMPLLNVHLTNHATRYAYPIKFIDQYGKCLYERDVPLSYTFWEHKMCSYRQPGAVRP